MLEHASRCRSTLPANQPMKQPDEELIGLAIAIVEVLDKRCKAGCHKPPWTDFKNADGKDIGLDVERLIHKAKRILQTHLP